MKSDPQTLSITLATADDDDDDFQDPDQAFSITQNLILSSLTNPSSQPLKLSNGARPRKRPKPAAASGKENRRPPKTLASEPRVSAGCKQNDLIRAEKTGLSAPVDSGSAEISLLPTSNSCSRVSSSCDPMKSCKGEGELRDCSNGKENCGIPLSLSSHPKASFGCAENMVIRTESRGLLAPFGSGAVVLSPTSNSVTCTSADSGKKVSKISKSCSDTDNEGLKDGKGGYYLMSIESRLLESSANAVSCGSKGGYSEEDGCVDFEPGTQLNALMDLCSNIDKEGSSLGGDLLLEVTDSGVESSSIQENGSVECPLCGADITDLSEGLRLVHTNDCLDRDATAEETVPVDDIKSNSPLQVADANLVVEWLKTLGLSRYEEVFTREEIDWETLQCLTEEDLVSIGVIALGPRKKIVHALSELRKRNNHTQDLEKDLSSATTDENIKSSIPGNKLITEYFQGAAVNRNRACNLSKPLHGIERSKDSVQKRAGMRNYNRKAKVKDIPSWCCIPGTPFRVDAFHFLRGDCSHWFLTHFHLDHYQGLTRNFCHGKIYCSSITAHLVNIKIGVPWDRLHILPINHKITISGVNLTCMDANHCPGSIIILFEPPNGKVVLHTGDFRFSEEMAKSPILQSCRVHTLVLDTTYCNPQYDFPKQEAVIQFVIEAIQAEAFNPKTLFLIGSYTIGKERLFLEIARLLRKKIYVGSAKLSLLRCLEIPEEDMQWFTANEMESHIHVVPMWTIASFKRMKHISSQYSGLFDLIVAFSPTGWSFGKGKKKTPGRRWQQGTIIRYEIPYSEHCSFSELREFVQFISPEHIIPSVNNDGPESVDAMITLLMSDP